jgi:hypothetical protein
MGVLTLTLLVGCNKDDAGNADHSSDMRSSLDGDEGETESDGPTPPARLFTESLGTAYTEVSEAIELELVNEVRLPAVNGRHAIWGASGRDERGHIWFGVSVGGARSAHLFEYDPETDKAVDRGGVIENLAQSGHSVPGVSQVKIHSKIWQADDGYLYFTSSDEEGEKEDGSQLPRWGSHFWRMDPKSGEWEHLLAAPEGLIAAACSGRYVYLLGYFGHVLYQWDIERDTSRSVIVGAAGGHISRNLVCDRRGHVFVPRVADLGKIPNAEQFSDERTAITTTRDGRAFGASLVEYDTRLIEIQQRALPGYDPDAGATSHGITAFSYLQDGRIAFATHTGSLFMLSAAADESPAELRLLGLLDPDKRVYPAGMISVDGKRWLAIATGSSGNHWIVWDLEQDVGQAVDVRGMSEISGRGGTLLYGTHTRGDDGSAYLVGRWSSPGGYQPLVVRIRIGN